MSTSFGQNQDDILMDDMSHSCNTTPAHSMGCGMGSLDPLYKRAGAPSERASPPIGGAAGAAGAAGATGATGAGGSAAGNPVLLERALKFGQACIQACLKSIQNGYTRVRKGVMFCVWVPWVIVWVLLCKTWLPKLWKGIWKGMVWLCTGGWILPFAAFLFVLALPPGHLDDALDYSSRVLTTSAFFSTLSAAAIAVSWLSQRNADNPKPFSTWVERTLILWVVALCTGGFAVFGAHKLIDKMKAFQLHTVRLGHNAPQPPLREENPQSLATPYRVRVALFFFSFSMTLSGGSLLAGICLWMLAQEGTTMLSWIAAGLIWFLFLLTVVLLYIITWLGRRNRRGRSRSTDNEALLVPANDDNAVEDTEVNRNEAEGEQ